LTAANDIEGSIPSELGNLASLKFLDLGECKVFFFQLSFKLTFFYVNSILAGNSFRGLIPTEFGSLNVLQSLNLSESNACLHMRIYTFFSFSILIHLCRSE